MLHGKYRIYFLLSSSQQPKIRFDIFLENINAIKLNTPTILDFYWQNFISLFQNKIISFPSVIRQYSILSSGTF